MWFKMEKLVLFVFFLLIISCATTKNMAQIGNDEPIQVTIQRIQNVDDVLYLYGTFNNRKIRIATTPQDSLEKNKSYDLKLTSLLELSIQYNAIPINYLHIDLSDYAISINDSTTLKLEHKGYKDLYLTEKMASVVVNVLNDIPLLKK